MISIKLIPALPVLCLALSCTAGWAQQSPTATASLSDFRFVLYDLHPDDGIAPQVTFSNFSGSATVQEWNLGWPSDTSSQDVDPVSGNASAILSSTDGDTATAQISGSLTAGSQYLRTSAATPAQGYRKGPEAISKIQADFSLTPGTVLVVEATQDVTSFALPPLAYGGNAVYGDAYVQIAVNNGLFVNGGETRVSNGGLGTGELDKHRDVRIAYANLGNDWVQGNFRASSGVYLAPTIPEPGSAPLLLAGLGGLGALMRRRRVRSGGLPLAD